GPRTKRRSDARRRKSIGNRENLLVPGPDIFHFRVLLQFLPILEVVGGDILVSHSVTAVRVPENASVREVRGSGPHLDGLSLVEQDNELVMRNCTGTLGPWSHEILNFGFANCLPIGVSRSVCFYPRVENDLHIRA